MSIYTLFLDACSLPWDWNKFPELLLPRLRLFSSQTPRPLYGEFSSFASSRVFLLLTIKHIAHSRPAFSVLVGFLCCHPSRRLWKPDHIKDESPGDACGNFFPSRSFPGSLFFVFFSPFKLPTSLLGMEIIEPLKMDFYCICSRAMQVQNNAHMCVDFKQRGWKKKKAPVRP